MRRKSVETTVEERKIIINLHNECKSSSEISRIVSRPRSTIKGIIDRYGSRKRVQNNTMSGRPRKLNQYNDRIIVRLIKKNPTLSACEITNELINGLSANISTSTVRNYLRTHGYHGRVARRKYFINEQSRKKRLEFGKTHRNTSMDCWNRVIFTNESKYNIFGSQVNTHL